MAIEQNRKAWTVGPTGEALTREELPKPGERWTAYRKATVVAALHGELVSMDEMIEVYGLTIEELSSWQRGFDRFGMAGLRMTYSQKIRDKIARDICFH